MYTTLLARIGLKDPWVQDPCLPRTLKEGFRVEGLGFRVQGSGLRVWGLGFRVEGLGFRA